MCMRLWLQKTQQSEWLFLSVTGCTCGILRKIRQRWNHSTGEDSAEPVLLPSPFPDSLWIGQGKVQLLATKSGVHYWTWGKLSGFSYLSTKLSVPSTVCLEKLIWFKTKIGSKKREVKNFLTCSPKHHYSPRKMTEEKNCSSSPPNHGIKTER